MKEAGLGCLRGCGIWNVWLGCKGICNLIMIDGGGGGCSGRLQVLCALLPRSVGVLEVQ